VVQTIETNLGVQLFDRSGHKPRLTEAGLVLVGHARRVLAEAAQLERTAATISAGLEPELTLAIDSMVPTAPVIASLARLQARFPELAVTLFTESISASVRRVRDGTAILGLCALLPMTEQELQAQRYASIKLVPVVAPSHLLAQETRLLTREILAQHVQLILTDPLQTVGPSFSIVSNRIWRFVDIGRRLDFLLAGFGWCMMPHHLVADHLAAGRLIRLPIDEPSLLPDAIPIFAIHQRSRALGFAARWLLQDFVDSGPAAMS
jgi:DNA-binding transcriptional LysR family regulator